MKVFRYILGMICSLAILVALLISSVELAVYGDMSFFEKEYVKYDVTADVDMELDDLMTVTEHMMAYLRGDADDLQIQTIVGGQSRGFFNDREIAHMADVRNLFLGGLALRRICLAIAFICIVSLILTKANLRRILPASFQAGTALFFVILAALAAIISRDFNRYFVIFHHIFFTNDLWLLDPATDLLINIVPEPFFMDTAARIGLVFAVFIVILLLISTGLRIYFKKKENISHV